MMGLCHNQAAGLRPGHLKSALLASREAGSHLRDGGLGRDASGAARLPPGPGHDLLTLAPRRPKTHGPPGPGGFQQLEQATSLAPQRPKPAGRAQIGGGRGARAQSPTPALCPGRPGGSGGTRTGGMGGRALDPKRARLHPRWQAPNGLGAVSLSPPGVGVPVGDYGASRRPSQVRWVTRP